MGTLVWVIFFQEIWQEICQVIALMGTLVAQSSSCQDYTCRNVYLYLVITAFYQDDQILFFYRKEN
jgi:hypothetical protein